MNILNEAFAKIKKISLLKISSLLILFIFVVLLFMILFFSNALAAQPFNIEIELPDSYKTVNPGNDVWFTIKLLNLANAQRVDVTLNYDILDSNGISIVHNSKTVAIETQASFVADLKIPETALPGEYTVNVVVASSLGESRAKTSLKILAPKNVLMFYLTGVGIILLLLLIFVLIKSKSLIAKFKLKLRIRKIVYDKLKEHK
jgi:hypothetical protein